MNKRIENVVAITIIVLVMGLFFYLKLSESESYKLVTKNYQISVGRMVDYSISGDADNRILTYEYDVKGKTYQRYITPSIYFDECYNNINMCYNRKFHVIYSSEYPDNSFIDLTRQIISIDSFYVSMNLANFE